MVTNNDTINPLPLIFCTEALDLKSAGVRNTDALVLTEASCLVLRYPKAHVRITAE